MAAPNVTAATRAKGGRRELQTGIDGKSTSPSYPESPFVLTIHAGDRRTVWGRYATAAESEKIGRALRVHGIDARTSDTREVRP